MENKNFDNNIRITRNCTQTDFSKAHINFNNPDRIWLEITEVTEMLRITDRTLRRWVLQGLLPVSYVNGKPFFRASDLENIFNNNLIQCIDGKFSKTK